MERVAVLGEWGVGNEWSGQRWLENDDRGKLERRDRTMRHRVLDAVLSFVMNFYFFKKTTTATFRSISSSDYQYDEYHQYH